MKIRSTIFVISLAYSLVIIAGSVAMWHASNQVVQKTLQIKFAETMYGMVSNRRGLVIEYLVNPHERIEVQWVKTVSMFDKIMLSPNVQEQKYRSLIAEINMNRRGAENLFDQLTVLQKQNAVDANFNDSLQIAEKKSTLVNGIVISSQMIVAQSKQLMSVSINELLIAQQRMIWITILFIVTLLVGLVFALIATEKKIVQPVLQLTQWARNFTKRNFFTEPNAINTISNDEIGELAKTFITMGKQLNGLYVNLASKVQQRTAQLAKAQAKDESILYSLGEGLIVTNKRGQITRVNPAFEQLLGWKEYEVKGKKLNAVTAMFDEQGESRVLQNVHGKIVRTTTQTIYYKRKNGTLFPVVKTTSPILLNNKVVGSVEVFRDITRAKEIDKAKSEFVSLASHQLRTPLGIMKWYLESLKNTQYIHTAPELVRSYIEQIISSNERVLRLANDLLSVSRIDQGHVHNNPERVDIGNVLQRIVGNMKIIANNKEIDLTLKLNRKSNPIAVIDSAKLTEVVENLVSNAIEYTLPSGSVVVSVSMLRSAILVKVHDTGIGISNDDKKKLFTKFFRSAIGSADNTSGSGLGLYVVKSYVESWGGKVMVQSRLGMGSTFTFTIPHSRIKKSKVH